MDESGMTPAPDAEEDGQAGADGQRAVRARRAAALPWRIAARCLLLAAVVGVVGYLSFRPGLLRFSILLSLLSPSRGESLAWKPEPGTSSRPAPAKFTPGPAEIRLSSVRADSRLAVRSELPAGGAWRGGELLPAPWRRDSHNPWSWPDDAPRGGRRVHAADGPGQKTESSFRASEATDWLAEVAKSAAGESGNAAAAGAPAFSRASPERVPSIAPLSPPVPFEPAMQPPALPAQSAPVTPPALRIPPTLAAEPVRPPSPPSSAPIPLADILPAATGFAQGLEPGPESPAAPTPELLRPPPSLRPPETRSAPLIPSAAPPVPPGPVDWRSREITAAIPGAYLTIYPRLKFIGLCVPGQGYIRKYNQVAVPADAESPKESAADGRTPYGRFAVASHSRDASGPRLELNWPGGGVALTGDRARTEETSGGFSLEAPHMEEIFTALSDGAAVFIQE